MTAEILGVEPIALHLEALLLDVTDGMNARILALNEVLTDLVLAPIRDIYVGGTPNAMEWPCGVIKEEDPRELVPLSESALNAYPLAIGWFDVDDGCGPKVLSQRLWRYRKIAEEIISDHRNEPGYWLTTSNPQPIAEGPFRIEEEPDRVCLIKGSRFWFSAFAQF